MFVCTRPFLLFDYFRVPYRLGGDTGPVAHLRAADDEYGSGALHWVPAAHGGSSLDELQPLAQLRFGSHLVSARVLPDDAAFGLLADVGGSWKPWLAIIDARGQRAGSVWRDDESVFLPFDPSEAIRNMWSESYMGGSARGRIATMARRGYYRVRPVVPRTTQIRLRRAFTRVQKEVKFPRWPIEPALHDLYEWLFELVSTVTGRTSPRLASWPNGCSWALILTHDVETAAGLANVRSVRQLELRAGVRSSWNLVPAGMR